MLFRKSIRMPNRLKFSYGSLARFGVPIFILGVVVRYSTGSAIGTIIALMGAMLVSEQPPLHRGQSSQEAGAGVVRCSEGA